MIKINVIVKDKTWLKYIKNPKTYFKRKIEKIQRDKFFKKSNYQFSLLLSETKEIKSLNKKFRKKKELKIWLKSNLEIYLGDIIINFKKMNISSKKLFKRHLNILLIHGLVHLFGHNHKKENSYKKMNAIEKKFLKKLN